eukprot:gene26382-32358_t
MTDMIINFPLALICRAAGVPLIYSMHTDIGKLLYGHGGLWLLRMLTELFLVRVSEASQALTAGICTAAITTSPSFMELLQSRGVRACTRFYAAIPAEEIINTYRRLQPDQIQDMRKQMTAGHPERRLLCYAGRWSVEKRMHLLKECVTQLPGNITLCFIGDGPIASIVQEWADEPRVVVLQGMRPRADLALVYAAADWIVSASDFETFGNYFKCAYEQDDVNKETGMHINALTAAGSTAFGLSADHKFQGIRDHDDATRDRLVYVFDGEEVGIR